MRMLTLGIATSLDNYIARADGRCDWLQWSEEAAAMEHTFTSTVDTVVMGRRTFEMLERNGFPLYPNMKNYVLTSRLAQDACPGVDLVRGPAAEFVRRLKEQSGKDIGLLGGGVLANALFREDLIDVLVLHIHPVLLGDGVPLFHKLDRAVNLAPVDLTACDNGNLIVTYQVLKQHAQ